MSNVQFFESNPRLSKAAVCNGMLYLAGMTDDGAADAAGQAQLVLDKVEEYLLRYGSDKRHIVSAAIYLSDMAYFKEFNRIWNDWVVDGYQPARTCVEAKLAREALLVEVTVVAALIER